MRVEVGKKSIAEMKSMKHPTNMIEQLMKCICHMFHAQRVIVGYFPNRSPAIDWWATSCAMMSDPDFYSKLVNYDNFAQMNEHVYCLLQRDFGDGTEEGRGWKLNNLRHQSNASAKLFEWVKCQMEIY